jgi:hypothetical protein
MEINEAERTWIAGNQQVVRSFAAERGVLPDGLAPVDPPVLDAAWAAWLEMHLRGEEDPNSIINAFGMAFGQVLIDRLDLEWKVVSDVVVEIALCNRARDIVIYPQNLVARRYMAGTTQFFAELAAELEGTLGPRLGRAASAPPVVAAAPSVASARVVGSGKSRRAKRAVGPGKPDTSAATQPDPVPSAEPASVESQVTDEPDGDVQPPKSLEPVGGGVGRIFRRGSR